MLRRRKTQREHLLSDSFEHKMVVISNVDNDEVKIILLCTAGGKQLNIIYLANIIWSQVLPYKHVCTLSHSGITSVTPPKGTGYEMATRL